MNDLLDELDKNNERNLPYHELTSTILGCCFKVMNELGPGFLERLYKNALYHFKHLYQVYQANPSYHAIFVAIIP